MRIISNFTVDVFSPCCFEHTKFPKPAMTVRFSVGLGISDSKPVPVFEGWTAEYHMELIDGADQAVIERSLKEYLLAAMTPPMQSGTMPTRSTYADLARLVLGFDEGGATCIQTVMEYRCTR